MRAIAEGVELSVCAPQRIFVCKRMQQLVKVRKWSESDVSSQRRGNGVTLRGLIPEPVPEGILSDAARGARGVSVVILAKAGV